MIIYKKEYNTAKEAGKEPPMISKYVGECFMKIANRLSYRPNFINYAFRDDMISDGIENCLQYATNFDPEKSKNPFAYFTQIIYYAFLRRIAKEKKQSHVKNKMIEKNEVLSYSTMEGDDRVYDVGHLDLNAILPAEDVYKPKQKTVAKKKNQ